MALICNTLKNIAAGPEQFLQAEMVKVKAQKISDEWRKQGNAGVSIQVNLLHDTAEKSRWQRPKDLDSEFRII